MYMMNCYLEPFGNLLCSYIVFRNIELFRITVEQLFHGICIKVVSMFDE